MNITAFVYTVMCERVSLARTKGLKFGLPFNPLHEIKVYTDFTCLQVTRHIARVNFYT